MQIKKEYIFVFTVSLIVLSYILESITGNVLIKVVGNPYNFLVDQNNLKRIPLSVFEVGIKSLAIFFSLGLTLSLFKKNYIPKFLFILFFAFLSQLYGIQQVMTRSLITPMTWTLAISYSGILSLTLGIYYLLQSLVYGINDKLISGSEKLVSKEINTNEESVLNPK